MDGYRTIEEVGAIVGVSAQVINYHYDKGNLPVPHRLGGFARIFDMAQVEEIKRFFAHRVKYGRKSKKSEASRWLDGLSEAEQLEAKRVLADHFLGKLNQGGQV
jgi:DNA-binding transcriptional MerR regulator